MAKIRPDYERSWWPRLMRWLKDGSNALDEDVEAELMLSAAPESAPAAAHEGEEDQWMLEKERELHENVRHWRDTRANKQLAWLYRLIAMAVCLGIIGMLLVTTSRLPPYGSPDNPVHNEVSQR